MSIWSTAEIRLGPGYEPFLGHPGDRRLNLGCGGMVWKDWINVDRGVMPGVDYQWDLERVPLPWETDSVTTIVASHVLEHISQLVPLMRDCHRMLRPDGHLVAITPYLSSDDAWEDPTHVRAFSDRSWQYFDRRLYDIPDQAGHYQSGVDFIFDIERIDLIPTDHWRTRCAGNENAMLYERMTYRNVVQEMRAILRKVAV